MKTKNNSMLLLFAVGFLCLLGMLLCSPPENSIKEREPHRSQNAFDAPIKEHTAKQVFLGTHNSCRPDATAIYSAIPKVKLPEQISFKELQPSVKRLPENAERPKEICIIHKKIKRKKFISRSYIAGNAQVAGLIFIEHC